MWFLHLAESYWGDEIEEDGLANHVTHRGVYGCVCARARVCINCKEIECLEDIDIDGRIVLNSI